MTKVIYIYSVLEIWLISWSSQKLLLAINVLARRKLRGRDEILSHLSISVNCQQSKRGLPPLLVPDKISNETVNTATLCATNNPELKYVRILFLGPSNIEIRLPCHRKVFFDNENANSPAWTKHWLWQRLWQRPWLQAMSLTLLWQHHIWNVEHCSVANLTFEK